MHKRRARIEQHHRRTGIMPLGEFHDPVDHRLVTAMHAIECPQRNHYAAVLIHIGPFDVAVLVGDQSRDVHA